MPKSRVELFVKNNWVRKSWHKNEEYAIINADMLSESRKCDARVICDGNVVHYKEYKPEEEK